MMAAFTDRYLFCAVCAMLAMAAAFGIISVLG